MSIKIKRTAYADMFGPTAGDKVRLADTNLVIEVEKDFTVYGDEVKFGGGKVIRDGMGQSQATIRQGAVDTVITNALILDNWGIVKADVGIKDGRIAAIGKAGNPDVQSSVSVIGPGTEVIAGEGKILTAGGFDTHIHFICPQQVKEALMSGVTTMLGGGTEPAHGAAGDKIPSKGGPGITRSDLLVINKIDLAPYVGASLEVMECDSRKMRGQRPFVMTNLREDKGVDEIARFIEQKGGLGA